MWLIYDLVTGAAIGGMSEVEPAPEPGQAAVIVPQSAIEGKTTWDQAVKGWVDVPEPEPAPSLRPIPLPFHSDGGANLTLTNQAAAAQFLANSNRNIEKLDLSLFREARLIARVVTAGAAAAKLTAAWAASFSTSIGNFADLGVSEIAAPMNAAGVADSGWIAIAAAAIGDDRFVTIKQSGGDGAADPALGRVTLWLR